MNFGVWPCRLYRFLAGLASIHAYNSFLLVAADRCLAVYFPFKFINVSNKTAIRLSLATLLVSLLSALPFVVMMGYVTVPEQKLVFCWLTVNSGAFQLYDALYVKGIAQMLLIFLINLALLIKMAQVTRQHNRLVNGGANQSNIMPKQLETEEMKATIMIVLLSVLVLICAVPAASLGLINYITVYISHNASNGQLQLMWNWLDISLFLVFLEQSTKWIVYLAQSRTFRRKMMIYLRYRRRS
ncbi:hypothetical protein BOX15_Mlig021078g2 [Macrostomum lignano]|uniref:G_PROTEIN_RECEP_F1_2 domain-containing protein n=2 Tax=Macrostomum lignano TaxID=282301 RepID=A0A1I8HJP3_9PLAT|nr:hypothetical protein BOX15_Mlig021078g1 [Macrostomum lignano]PAA79064.1 hypothetical protein BOX15_Mlig021078g2 [Macrostomum lignano]